MKLELIHNEDKVVILAVESRENIVFKLRERGSQCIMAIRDDALIINLDLMREMPNFLLFPQYLLHEFLHLISRYSFHTAKLIHKIHRKTRGMLV